MILPHIVYYLPELSALLMQTSVMHVVIYITCNMILTCRIYLLLYLTVYYILYYVATFYLCTLLQKLVFFSTLIIMPLVMSILPKYVVLKSVLSSNLVACDTSVYMPSYLSKYSSFSLSPSKLYIYCQTFISFQTVIQSFVLSVI